MTRLSTMNTFKFQVFAVRRVDTGWHKHAMAILIAALVSACGSGGSSSGSGSGGGSASNGSGECCAATCISQIGEFPFKSKGMPISVSGHAVITNVDDNKVLLDVMMTNSGDIPTSNIGPTALDPYVGKTINVRVDVTANGYLPFTGMFQLPVTMQMICCSSCATAMGGGDIVLLP